MQTLYGAKKDTERLFVSGQKQTRREKRIDCHMKSAGSQTSYINEMTPRQGQSQRLRTGSALTPAHMYPLF